MGNGMEETHSSRKRELIATMAVFVVIVLIVVGVTLTNKSDNTTATNTSPQDTAASSSVNKSLANDSVTYKDGEYSATGKYSSPGGQESIDVSLTVASNTVTAISANAKAADHESKEYQNKFLSAYKNLVIGKKINNMQLDRVSGSSLTSQGFNSALEQIRTKAQG